MKLTKFEHACFAVESENNLVLIDPGNLTTDLGRPENLVAVVITHQHADHFHIETLVKLLAANPAAKIFAPKAVVEQINSDLPHQEVSAGEIVEVSNFKLEFFGGSHSVIHETIAPIDNLGVMINNSVYYPGDSFTQPNRPVDVLALPVSAPWLKISETMNFLQAVKPRFAFPTHNAVLSAAGQEIVDRMLINFSTGINVTYQNQADKTEF